MIESLEVPRGEPQPLPNSMKDVVRRLFARHGGTPEKTLYIQKTLLDDYNIGMSLEELEAFRLGGVNKDKIAEYRREIKQGIEQDNKLLFNKANALLHRRLGKALSDSEKVEAFDAALENGIITKKEHRDRTSHLINLTTHELMKLMKELKPPEPPQQPLLPQPTSQPVLPAGMPEEAIQALQARIAAGDPIELQRILWQGTTPPLPDGAPDSPIDIQSSDEIPRTQPPHSTLS